MSQPYPPQPPYGQPQPGWAPPPKKTPTGKIIGFGCLGVIALFVVIGVIAAALGGNDTSNDTGAASTSSAPAVQKDDPKPSPKATEKNELAVKITAKKTAFTKSVLADGTNYTSVQVTIINNSDDTISVNPLYFTITDTNGTKHTHQLAVDKSQIGTVKLAPGENVSGTITGDGKFTPKYLTYTDGLLGDPVRADVA